MHLIAETTAPTGKLEKMAKRERFDSWRDRILIAAALLAAAMLSHYAPW